MKMNGQNLKKLGRMIRKYKTEIAMITIMIIAIILIIILSYFSFGTFSLLWLWHQQRSAVVSFLIILAASMLYPLLSSSQKLLSFEREGAVGQNTNIIIKIGFIAMKIVYFLFLVFILLFVTDFFSFSLGLFMEVIKSVSTIPRPSYCQGLAYGNGNALANLYMTTKSSGNLSSGAAILNFYSSLAALAVFTTEFSILIMALLFLVFWPLTLALSNSMDFACYGEAPKGFKGLLQSSSYIISLFGISFISSYFFILFALATYFTSPYSQFVALYLTIAAALLTFLTEWLFRSYKSLWNTLYSGLFYVSIISLLAFIALTSNTQYLLCLSGFSARNFEFLLTFASIVGAIPFAYTLSAAYNYYLCQLAKHKDKDKAVIFFLVAFLMAVAFLFLYH